MATYDKNGKIIRTAEKFKNVALPKIVAQSVATRFPMWSITEDAYLVTYQEESGATKIWKLLLKNDDQRLNVKVNEKGEFIK